ncbi:MAG: ParB/RepB/Spo0J family partition protein [Oscillospiraceae bacterium]|nr:ParB/RepB/Spo0J family partition protein [Oscillospiraceae bacterium]MBR3953645.1 ParB/RepB/Spo0J family partition protein [Oscillospiraceae bacterium]
MAKARGLGKGLDALFADSTGMNPEDSGISTVRLSEIEPNLSQPRKDFDEEALGELADSIAAHGILQPLLIRPTKNGMYQIVAGERRWRAARLAGLSEVPALIRELSDEETDKVALIENLQREDLNAVETAEGYKRLMDKYGMTQEQLSDAVGKSRPAVANTLRILNLPKEVLPLVSSGSLSAGHAKAILSAPEEKRTELAKMIVSGGLSVREAEKIAAKIGKEPKEKAPKKKDSFPKDKFYREMQVAMTDELGRPFKITENEKGGTIEIPFYSKEELADFCERILKKKM